MEIADEWEGPARPGGYVEWRRGEGRKVEKGDGWWDPVKGRVGDVPENFSPGMSWPAVGDQSIWELRDGS